MERADTKRFRQPMDMTIQQGFSVEVITRSDGNRRQRLKLPDSLDRFNTVNLS